MDAQPAPVASLLLRGWLAFAAIGAALVHIALVVGAPAPTAAALGALGVLELGWGVLTLGYHRLVAARLALVIALAPVLVLATAAATSTVPSRMLTPLVLAATLQLGAAVLLAAAMRRRDERPASGPVRYLVGLFAGALVVGAIVTPALAATTAGEHAQPHGGIQTHSH